jgi:isocitrate lyase
MRPHKSGAELLELNILNDKNEKVANAVFSYIHDLRGKNMLSFRDHNTFDLKLRQKRLSTLLHLFLIHRYKSDSVIYVNPTPDNMKQSQGMRAMGIYKEVSSEIGDVITASVNPARVAELLATDQTALKNLISKKK